MNKPQDVLKDYQSDKYLEENRLLLLHAYKALYEGLIKKEVLISKEIKADTEIIVDFFDSLNAVAEKDKEKIASNPSVFIAKSDIKKAVIALSNLVRFVIAERTNVNNLNFFCWALFNTTRYQDLKTLYLDKIEAIEQAILNQGFLHLVINYPNFGQLMIRDLLMPIELNMPTRRKGSFGENVFRLISKNLQN